ncbi:hypothetical protein J4219_04735 [Candidatus Woesearchaeota archaeon]|nr:hypothetical protein [Candidatus Woesearchaeota archaeon]
MKHQHSDSSVKQKRHGRKKTIFPDNWQYSKHANKRRYCEGCGNRLRKHEPDPCDDCQREREYGADMEVTR